MSHLIGGVLAAAEKSNSEMECRFVSVIEDGFLSNHVNKTAARDEELKGKVIDQYLKRLDGSKTYLIESDIADIRKLMKDTFDKIKKGDCSFLSEVQKILIKRTEERVEFAKKFLGKDYKFDEKAEFVYEPDKKPWAKNSTELDEYIKKYIHFQVANYRATDLKMDEAKKNVLKIYERALKRVKEEKDHDLYDGYLDSFARALDPHSSFFSKDVLDDFDIQMKLSLEGIGATLSNQDGFTVIEQLVPGGAAAKSGLLEPQDKIIAVGQESGGMENVIDMDLKEVVKKIRGPKGTKVRLTIIRKKGDEKNRMEVSLVRDKVNLEDEAASIIFIDKEIGGQKKKVGLINFPSFYADSRSGGRSSAKDLKRLLKEANEKKVDGIILDLSTNGGGSLEDAVKAAGLFFQTGNVVKQSSKIDLNKSSLKVESKDAIPLEDKDSTVDWAGPLVVLTSRVSASASEIVAGALQDYKRAIIVGGDHTFGKGSVQSVLPIPKDLGAIKVTVGMFFIPGGNSTQHRGVEGDIPLPSVYNADDIGEKYLDYSLPPAKTDSFLSGNAIVKEGAGAWKEIKTDWIKSLRDKSKMRVEKNAEFKKINDEIEKAKVRGKTIKVSEILKDKNEKEKKAKAIRAGGKEQRNKEYLKRADIQESVNILLDLINLESEDATSKQVSN